ncbi:SDR family oxidoreductase [Paenibacillus sacheonensis]|uniref:SDR family NAD(P)-dependent oxidoreductase n=1 Tax=Paenibacillus sacheonensis TaxID=742054 RepID=A0A7X4YN68_9BACL|nr:SDR family oxidoreductase [Paenibacillus sacheonensis]MBM7566060.1 NAD(P)-dependent dehydrogenase (short-subunit alcohol dehydrogenase family) [Paenibacillus sacheonensis]NBC68631.1 SDR family NAD(P)-dependent oxidoreductase [Paenibacillus sacheonensis]
MTTFHGNLEGKVAFITGGNRGIGLQTARDLGKLGAQVVIGSRDAEKGKAAAESLASEGIRAESIQFDVLRAEDRQAAFDYFEQRHGKLDILINNAGVQKEVEHLMPMNETSTVPPAILRETFDANFFTLVELTQLLLPLIRRAPAGRIVNLSSVLGSLSLHADPSAQIYGVKVFAYDASKAAVNMFTIHLAHELRDTPIKVNSAHPGWVRTEIGGKFADLDVSESSKTSVMLATLPDDGPSGQFFYLDNQLPW